MLSCHDKYSIYVALSILSIGNGRCPSSNTLENIIKELIMSCIIRAICSMHTVMMNPSHYDAVMSVRLYSGINPNKCHVFSAHKMLNRSHNHCLTMLLPLIHNQCV